MPQVWDNGRIRQGFKEDVTSSVMVEKDGAVEVGVRKREGEVGEEIRGEGGWRVEVAGHARAEEGLAADGGKGGKWSNGKCGWKWR